MQKFEKAIFAGALALTAIAFVGVELDAAFAQTVVVPATATAVPSTASNAVVIPWGDWSTEVLNSLASVLILIISGIVGKYAPAVVKTFLTETTIQNAVNYALAAESGAVAGKTLTVTSTNSVLTTAESYIVANAPALATRVDALLRPMILARLSAAGVVPAEATAAAVGATLPPATK